MSPPTVPTAIRFLSSAATALVAALLVSSPAAAQPSPSYDLLLAGGRLVDGTGSPWVRADVAVRDDRIAAIGRDLGTARDTIDATRLVVAPGFIDVLGHSEFRLLADGRATSKIHQGVTTEITGEVSSVVPASERPRAERERAIEPWGVEYTWDDLGGYLERLESQGIAINLGTWVGLSSLWLHGVGPEDRRPTAAEMDRMKAALRGAMERGAFGLSSGLVYAPGRYATTDEIVALATVAAEHGGIYATHMRSEGSELLAAIDEAIQIGERGGVPVLIHHLKASGRANWGTMDEAVARIAAARARGVDVMANVYPYTASSTGLDAILPGWFEAETEEETLARLRDPAWRDSLETFLAGTTDAGEPELATSAGGPDGVLISDVVADSLAEYEGMRLSEIAAARGQRPETTLVDLLVGDGLHPSAVYFSMSEDDLETAIRQPWTMIGGDAGVREFDGPLSTDQPHPRAFGTFPRVLCRYSREKGLFTLEEGVRKMTSLPAARIGLGERGVVKEGLVADLVIFDAGEVCDQATFEEPKRLAVGIRHVLVNGTPVLRDGEPTGALPGRGLTSSSR